MVMWPSLRRSSVGFERVRQRASNLLQKVPSILCLSKGYPSCVNAWQLEEKNSASTGSAWAGLGLIERFTLLGAQLLITGIPAPMIAELLTFIGLSANPVDLPALAHLAPGAGISGAAAFVVHGRPQAARGTIRSRSPFSARLASSSS